MINLFGTVTSPYVRRVRVVAQELGLDLELVDVFTEQGRAALAEVSPIWKVPAAEVDGQLVFDSRVIVDHLLRVHGGDAELRPIDPADLDATNVVTVIDGALDALINVFYLGRDGIEPSASKYVAKQVDRARSAMEWLETRVDDVWLSGSRRFGLPELALCTTMDWMRFRDTYEIDQHPGLKRCFDHHRVRESLAATAPPDAMR